MDAGSRDLKTRILILCLLIPLAPGVTQAGVQEPLCPPETDRAQSLRDSGTGQTITAPASPEEAAALLAGVSSEDPAGRNLAVSALALGGNLEAFRYLLQGRDPALSLYALTYRNGDGSRCVDPRIESAILRHLDDPALSRAMHAFLTKNLYRSQRLFDALIVQPFDPSRPYPYREVARSLTATRLPGVEGQVLEVAEGLPPHTRPRLRWVMPEIQEVFVRYFGRRRYEPAIPYLEAILSTQEPPGEDKSILSRHLQTRFVIYGVLDGFDSERGSQILIEQLGRLGRAPRDNLLYAELLKLGEQAVRNTRSAADKTALVQHLGRLLDTPPPIPAGEAAQAHALAYDVRIRKTVYGFLSTVGTTSSASRLVAELEGLKGHHTDPQTASSLRVAILDALVQLPADTELDVPRFLAALDPREDLYRTGPVPEILLTHPHPAGFRQLLSQLERILDHGDTQRDVATFTAMVARLSKFDGGRYREATRDELDRLHREGRLDAQRFLAYSAKLNEKLGTESPEYLAVLERRTREAAEKRQREWEAKRAQWQQQLNAQIAENTSSEAIRQHIQRLSQTGGGARTAATWLVAAGTDTLPHAHRALRDSEASLALKLQLMTVLGAIGDPRSVPPIIETTRAIQGHEGVYKQIFLALGEMPATQAASAFAASQLEQDRPAVVQRSALVYFALQREQKARPWAERFSSADAHPEVRLAGLYLAAALGDQGAKAPIVELLQTSQDRSARETLVRALAELAPPDELEGLLTQLGISHQTRAYRDSLRYAAFRHGSGHEKIAAAAALLESRYPFDRRMAVGYLMEADDGKTLAKHFHLPQQYGTPMRMVPLMSPLERVIMNEARRMGYGVDASPNGVRFTKMRRAP